MAWAAICLDITIRHFPVNILCFLNRFYERVRHEMLQVLLWESSTNRLAGLHERTVALFPCPEQIGVRLARTSLINVKLIEPSHSSNLLIPGFDRVWWSWF